ncbi:hypothetical protein [Sphingomonas sp.]|uniref:hypothetical protein n=1 Tax=Sphingomonas sp. TaxID=28214 RepID=UPI003D6D6B2C
MLSYDEAIERALDAFHSAHPTETLPAWFKSGAFREDTVSRLGKIQVRYYAQPALPLAPNQKWIETNKGPIVQEVDPISGETRVVISRDAPKNITLFRVEVDPVSGDTSVIEDRDISAIADQEIETPKHIVT